MGILFVVVDSDNDRIGTKETNGFPLFEFFFRALKSRTGGSFTVSLGKSSNGTTLIVGFLVVVTLARVHVDTNIDGLQFG